MAKPKVEDDGFIADDEFVPDDEAPADAAWLAKSKRKQDAARAEVSSANDLKDTSVGEHATAALYGAADFASGGAMPALVAKVQQLPDFRPDFLKKLSTKLGTNFNTGSTRDFQELKADAVESAEALNEKAPTATLIGQAAGAIVPGATAARAARGAQAAGHVVPGALGSRVVRGAIEGAKAGAPLGAIAGAGATETGELGDVLEKAGGGAVLGAAAGGALGGAAGTRLANVELLKRGAGNAKSALGGSTLPKREAQGVLGRLKDALKGDVQDVLRSPALKLAEHLQIGGIGPGAGLKALRTMAGAGDDAGRVATKLKSKAKPSDLSKYEAEVEAPKPKPNATESPPPEMEEEELVTILEKLKGKVAPPAAAEDEVIHLLDTPKAKAPAPAPAATAAPQARADGRPDPALLAAVMKGVTPRSAAQDRAAAEWIKNGRPKSKDGPRGRQRAAAPFQEPLPPRGKTAKGNLAFTEAEQAELLAMPMSIFDQVADGKMTMAEARAALAAAAE